MRVGNQANFGHDASVFAIVERNKIGRNFLRNLRGDLGGNDATQRLYPRNGEPHVPEIVFWRDELHSNILLSVARAVDGNDAAFRRLRCMVVDNDEGLPHNDNFFEVKKRAVPIHGL